MNVKLKNGKTVFHKVILLWRKSTYFLILKFLTTRWNRSKFTKAVLKDWRRMGKEHTAFNNFTQAVKWKNQLFSDNGVKTF